MTRAEIKKGSIYIAISEEGSYLQIAYICKIQPPRSDKLPDGTYLGGKGFSLINKFSDDTRTFDDQVDKTLDLLIDDLEKNQGLENVLRIVPMPNMAKSALYDVQIMVKLLRGDDNGKS